MKASIIRTVIAVALVFSATGSLVAEVIHLDVEPGSQYAYLASPQSSCGLSSEDPLCSFTFGVSGSFDVVSDPGSDIVTLANVDLTLTGADGVQLNSNPMLTAGGASEWLEGRVFERVSVEETPDLFKMKRPYGPRGNDIQISGPFTLYSGQEQLYWEFGLVDHLDGSVSLYGGYNHTPTDGDGMFFELTAVAVPEPSTLALGLLGLAGFAVVGRMRIRA